MTPYVVASGRAISEITYILKYEIHEGVKCQNCGLTNNCTFHERNKILLLIVMFKLTSRLFDHALHFLPASFYFENSHHSQSYSGLKFVWKYVRIIHNWNCRYCISFSYWIDRNKESPEVELMSAMWNIYEGAV